MCDYSLMAVPSRLAVCGEELVAHRFDTGAKGFVSSSDAQRLVDSKIKPKDPLKRLWWMLMEPPVRCTAVCIPPGARLWMREVPKKLERDHGIRAVSQEVVFTQTSAETYFRDALRFAEGQQVSLQELEEGLRVQVISMSSSEYTIPDLRETEPGGPDMQPILRR